jgi:hypothetical protein
MGSNRVRKSSYDPFGNHHPRVYSNYVGTPQQNKVAECKNRDLLEKTRSLMIHMHVPKMFWSHRVLSVAYLINWLPSQVLHFKSSLEVLQKQPPNLSHLQVFGCTCFVHIQTSHQDKLDPRVAKCIFLGYSATQKDINAIILLLKDCSYQERSDLKKALYTLKIGINKMT